MVKKKKNTTALKALENNLFYENGKFASVEKLSTSGVKKKRKMRRPAT